MASRAGGSTSCWSDIGRAATRPWSHAHGARTPPPPRPVRRSKPRSFSSALSSARRVTTGSPDHPLPSRGAPPDRALGRHRLADPQAPRPDHAPAPDAPAPASISDLQRQLDAFRDYYNQRRPHRSLDRQTPAAVFNSRLKARPADTPAPVDHRVRRDKVDRFGKLTLRYLGRLRHIPVGVAHKNRKVRIFVAGADVRVVTEDGELLRALTLDPTRSYQPLAGRWPVHNVLPQACTMS